jgi:hypothetical protein
MGGADSLIRNSYPVRQYENLRQGGFFPPGEGDGRGQSPMRSDPMRRSPPTIHPFVHRFLLFTSATIAIRIVVGSARWNGRVLPS